MKFRNETYDLTAVDGVDKLSDLIDRSQVNDCRSIAYSLMQQPAIQVSEKEQQYKQALEDIKKHIEFIASGNFNKNDIWNIANKALSDIKPSHKEAVE